MARVVFEVLVTGSSESDFNTNCTTLETAFRTPRRRLIVKFGSTTFLDMNPATNTGFEQQPQCEKIADVTATGRSRRYRCTVTAQLPADDNSGRLRVGVTLSKDPALRRQVTITGLYTAVAGPVSARAQFLATIDAYANSVFTALGVTGSAFQLVREEGGPGDIADKNLDFTRVYEEVIYGATSDTLSHASIRQHRTTFNLETAGPGDTPGKSATRLQTLTATFEGWVDQTALAGLANLKSLWTSIRTRLLSEAQAKFNPSAIAIASESPHLDPTTNRISGVLVLRLVPSGAKTIEYSREVEYFDDFGKELVPVWDGNAYSKEEYQGPASCRRTTTEIEVAVGNTFPEESSIDANALNIEPAPGGGHWVRKTRLRRGKRLRWGTAEKNVDVYASVIVTVDECAATPNGGGGPVITPPSGSITPVDGRGPGGSVPPGLRAPGDTTSGGSSVFQPPTRSSPPPAAGRGIRIPSNERSGGVKFT